MKKLLSLALIFCLLASVSVSCKEEEEDTPAPAETSNGSGTVVYNGKTFQAKTGVYEDKGATSLGDGDHSHYNYAFNITDASPSTLTRMTFNLYLEMFSAGTSGFRTGTFEWFHPFEFEQEEVQNTNSFWGDLYVDGNNDGVLGMGDDMHEIWGGQVTVSGSGTDYTISYNLTLEDGKTITGSFTGKFIKAED
ncbi:hypothetical protein [Cesiribacter sp. SM1]|uniref:hypothetical protein n=1 Tax=Cesiribacter sp. SM1 TaxID=2861196 RepID=UPI001CD65036|nr:hypothetical protein [Cesiribacter sp. SM1]